MGYDKYKKGDILLMYVDRKKTSYAFEKRRRNFDELGQFISYENGSVKVKWVTNPEYTDPIRIPIFYTKK